MTRPRHFVASRERFTVRTLCGLELYLKNASHLVHDGEVGYSKTLCKRCAYKREVFKWRDSALKGTGPVGPKPVAPAWLKLPPRGGDQSRVVALTRLGDAVALQRVREGDWDERGLGGVVVGLERTQGRG